MSNNGWYWSIKKRACILTWVKNKGYQIKVNCIDFLFYRHEVILAHGVPADRLCDSGVRCSKSRWAAVLPSVNEGYVPPWMQAEKCEMLWFIRMLQYRMPHKSRHWGTIPMPNLFLLSRQRAYVFLLIRWAVFTVPGQSAVSRMLIVHMNCTVSSHFFTICV